MADQECLDAQRVVSETYDGGVVQPADIQRARAHCEGCVDCASFVSTLATVRRVPLPGAPADSVERAIEAVRAQKRADDQTAANAIAAAEPSRADAVENAQATPRHARPAWVAYAGWGAAAAAALIVAGLVTLQGARYIVGSDGDAAIQEGEYRLVEDAAAPIAGLGMSADSGAQADASAAQYITVGQWVYELVGAYGANASAATTYGATLTSLDGPDAPMDVPVLTTNDSGRVIVDDEGQLLEFALVSRVVFGKTYAMQSRAITGFGQWPTLPNGIPEPTNADGSPQFTPAMKDGRGVQTYRQAGGTDDRGIAVAPGTDSSDPAAGNPNWTWWAIVE